MKIWIIIGIITLLALFAGISMLALTNANNFNADLPNKESTIIGCAGCGNACTSESNCGLATCGAVSGKEAAAAESKTDEFYFIFYFFYLNLTFIISASLISEKLLWAYDY